jgi:hypothetical protein
MARLPGRDIHSHAQPNGTPLWLTAVLSSIGAACTLFFVQWMTAPPAVTALNGDIAQAEITSGTTLSNPAPASVRSGDTIPDDSAASKGTGDGIRGDSVPSPEGNSVPQEPRIAASVSTSSLPEPDPRREAFRRMAEKAARGEPLGPGDLAAGFSMTEEEKKLAFPDANPEQPIAPESTADNSAESAGLPKLIGKAEPEKESPMAPVNPSGQVDKPLAAVEDSADAPSASSASGTAPEFPPVNHAWADVKESLRISIPEKSGDSRRPQFSGIRPEFIQFNRSLIEVCTGREIAKLPAEFSSDSALVSSDGVYVLRYNGRSGSKLTTVYVHQVKSPATFSRIDCTRFRSVKFIQLLTPRLLLVAGDTSSSDRWTIWNIETGEEVASFKIANDERNFGQNQYCVNPAGNRLLVTASYGGGRLFDLLTGQIAAQLEPIPKHDDQYAVHGTPVFSPDGKEIAAIVNPSQIAVWSDDGRLIQHETVPGLAGKPYQEVTSLEWLPDSSGWFVNGRQLIDRTTSIVLWELLSDRIHIDRDTTSCVLSRSQVLVISGEDEDREFMPVRIPWDQIKEKLQAIRTNEPVELKAGATVSVVLDIGELRLATNEQVSAQLKQSAQELLKNTGLQDTPNQPIQLVLRHVEAAERNRLGGGIFPGFGGGDEGQRASDTKISTVIELRDSKTNSLYWRGQHEATGWLYVRENQTEQALRDAAFAEAIKQIGRVVLPTRVFPGDRQGLPIQSPAP